MSNKKTLSIQSGPDRWNGFVYLAWGIAIITWLFSGYLLLEAGTIKLPYGGSRLNVGIWAWVIGQSLGVLLLAGIFSMLNSIYKNTCRIALVDAPMPITEPLEGVEITSVANGSPLASKAGEGIVIKSVNGHSVGSYQDVNNRAKEGSNELMLRYPGGQVSRITVNSENGILFP